jgi:DDE superfamily endonuclease
MLLRVKFMNSRTNSPTRELQTASVYFDQLHVYYQNLRQQGIGILQRELAIQLNKIMNNGVPTQLSDSKKHLLKMRVSRWLKRIGVTLRCGTHIGQNIVFDNEIMETFAIETVDAIVSNGIPASHIVNMDKTKRRCSSWITTVPMRSVLISWKSKLQVLDVGVNKPFKQYTRGEYVMFLQTRTHPRQLPRRLDVANWIIHAWEQISVETILNTWRKVGLIDFDAEMPPVDPIDDEQYYAVQDEQEEEMEFLTEEGLQGPHDFPTGEMEDTEETEE